MPAWSTEIANEFIRLAATNGQAFDQMQLQKLVYIAHGWCLAVSDGPLTGDRPEAWELGPIYRRMADALAPCGQHPVRRPIEVTFPLAPGKPHPAEQTCTELDEVEQAVIAKVLLHYGAFSSPQLSVLTRGEDAPWERVYLAGEGRYREIAHSLIRDQFVRLAHQIGEHHHND
jgi:uncharacterized phage-associated protein